jgi:hypothetical protein
LNPKRLDLNDSRTLTRAVLLGIAMSVLGVIALAAALIIGGGAKWPLWILAVVLLLASAALNGLVLGSARRKRS